MDPNETSGIKTWQWVVTVIVIIALIVLGYSMFSGSNTKTNTNTEQSTDTENTNNTAINNPNRIIVSDQAPGNRVYISTVQLSKPGFVVIQKNSNGTLGQVIGNKYFDAGIYPGTVNLSTPTEEGSMYYAVLYYDTDGDKKFDIKKDMPIKDSAGTTIMRLFKVTVTPTELKG